MFPIHIIKGHVRHRIRARFSILQSGHSSTADNKTFHYSARASLRLAF